VPSPRNAASGRAINGHGGSPPIQPVSIVKGGEFLRREEILARAPFEEISPFPWLPIGLAKPAFFYTRFATNVVEVNRVGLEHRVPGDHHVDQHRNVGDHQLFGNLTITNTGTTPIKGWTLSFDFGVSISSIWNATLVNQSGSQYTISDAGYSATIQPAAYHHSAPSRPTRCIQASSHGQSHRRCRLSFCYYRCRRSRAGRARNIRRRMPESRGRIRPAGR
jgi:hypothetical protein